jgi:NADP-dependent 3-hydroxy acid dehydrogenase YdfG
MSKVIFITGVSSGLGKHTAEHLALNGFTVYGSSRSGKPIDGEVIPIKMDVTDVKSIQEAIVKIIEKEGKIDVLINNAGMGISGAIEEATTEEIKLQMDTNFMGMIHVIQTVLPSMRHQGSGTIINMSSLGGICALPFQGFYCASKFAIVGFSDSLRMEVKPFNIKVVVIEPGDFHTNFTANRMIQEKAKKDSPYEAQFRKTMEIIEKDETGGIHPDILAHKILKIVKSKNPCQVYVVSSLEQRLVPIIKRLLPNKWFYAIIGSHYGVK